MNKKKAEEILKREREKFKIIGDLRMYIANKEEEHNKQMSALKWILYRLEQEYMYKEK